MATNANNSTNTGLSPETKGSIQFSSSTKSRQSTPNGTFNPNIQDETMKRSQLFSPYDYGSFKGSQSFIFNSGEYRQSQILNKELSPNSRLNFRPNDKNTIHKRNRSNFNDLTKFISNPSSLLTSQPQNNIPHFSTVSTPMASIGEESKSSNPQYGGFTIKNRKLINLSKNKSEIKLGLHGPCIDDFEIGKKLGKGNFGDVYLVRHTILGFIFALKIISKNVVRQKKMQKQIFWEAAINMTLTHPNITQMYGMFDDQQNIYFIEELMTDGHLFKKMKQTKRTSQNQTASIIKGILQGVQYMHRMSIIHRDLKPQNIFMTMGMYKIGDFSWSIYTPDLLRETFCGTPLYMSPEILKGQKYDQGVDIWAAGILTYQLLVGKPPFKITKPEQLQKIINQEIKFPQHLDLSQNSKNFISKLLNKNAQQRIDVDDLLLHSFLKGQNQSETQMANLMS